MPYEIHAVPRPQKGKSAMRRMRRAGKVPGIVYGANEKPVSIEVDHNALYHQLKHEAFHSRILSVDVNGSKQQVLLRAVQMHPARAQVLHVDFQRVSQTEKIHLKIPLHFINADTAPGVKLAGGIVSHVMTEVDVSCLPKDLPEYIEVDLAHLEAGHSIHVSELKLPAGVEFSGMAKTENPTVVTITIPRVTVEEERQQAAEAEAAAMPEATAQKSEAAAEGADKDKEKDKEKVRDKDKGKEKDKK
jgi:large subunit ribosomal protein L25